MAAFGSMDLLLFLIINALLLILAYRFIGAGLARIFGLGSTPDHAMPSQAMRDGLDHEPLRTTALLPQHFSAIAAAGPIVGPILAALYFGWGPAWLWIILGSILIGGIHDFTALMASVRHKGRSVAEIVRQYMNPRAYLLFLVFVWCALIYVIIAFADVTAGTFVAAASTADGAAPGPAVATSSLLYLGLAVAMGLALRHGGLSPLTAKAIFLPLVALAIALGPLLPLDIGPLLPEAITPQRAWGFLLLGYCLFAALAPVWLLLQPRGELGGWFLYIVMSIMVLGVLFGAFLPPIPPGATEASWQVIQYPFFKGWTVDAVANPGITGTLFPLLFITVACGACSGFHSIVASGTTSKQLQREVDAKPIGYGAMLLEGFLACLSLTTVMILLPGALPSKPDSIYANGVTELATRILAPLGLDSAAARTIILQFALLCFATFVFDTLDACTRLARYVLMELLGWQTRSQAVIATILCLIPPVLILALPPLIVNGRPRALWQVFWAIFGSSNQLLAALTLLGVTVWMARKTMPFWIALGPTIFMMIMTLWSLFQMLQSSWLLHLSPPETGVPAIESVKLGIIISLIVLCLWLVVEALITWRDIRRPPTSAGEKLSEAVPA